MDITRDDVIDGVKIIGGLAAGICASGVAEAVIGAILPAPVNLVGKIGIKAIGMVVGAAVSKEFSNQVDGFVKIIDMVEEESQKNKKKAVAS